jgi:hypothetical protein
MKTQIVKVKISELNHAEWNYKTSGTEEQIQKLMKSIQKYGPGIPAVRHLEVDGKDVLEVMDGNHRLTAMQRLGFEEVTVENFGEISQAEAVIITRNRNQNWFEDDKLMLANLMNDHVFNEYTMEELSSFMPETQESLGALKMLAEAEWSDPESGSGSGTGGGPPDETKKIFLKVSEEVFNLWEKWLGRCENITGLENAERAFEFAVIEALNVPEEQLLQPSQK